MSKESNATTLTWFATAVAATTAVVAAVTAAIVRSSKTPFYYFDYNGTTQVHPEVLEVMLPYLKKHYGNPSSSHLLGRQSRHAINHARRQILYWLLGESSNGKAPSPHNNNNDYYLSSILRQIIYKFLGESRHWEANSPNKNKDNKNNNDDYDDLSTILFTGSGTESDNLAIQLALQSTTRVPSTDGTLVAPKRRPHIVTSNVEHPAVKKYLTYLEVEKHEVAVTYVPVNSVGQVLAQDVIDAITEATILVTLMTANNESGALQPVKEVAQECRERGILFHTDAAQAAGKVLIRLDDLGRPDMVSFVGHKFGAPKAIGALYVRRRCFEENGRNLPRNRGIMLIGGGQEFGLRAGTENTPYIVGMGKAAELAGQNLTRNATHMETMRTRLLKNLQDKVGENLVLPNGPEDPNQRLPNTLSVGFNNVQSGPLLNSIGHVVGASAGATCHGTGTISSVLRAMNVPESYARGTLRLSLGPNTTARDVDEASKIIVQAIQSQLQNAIPPNQ